MTRSKPKEKAKTVTQAPPSAPEENESGIPEELATIWDKEIAAAFQALRPQQQDFLLHYLRCGNQAEAYRRAYNPAAKDHLASNAGGQALESIGISAIMAKFANQKTAMLFKVIAGYNAMAEATKPEWEQDKDGQWENVGDAPDWQARKEALIGIRKVFGLDSADKVEHSGGIAMTQKYEVPTRRKPG